MSPPRQNRRRIYYWKVDRADAFRPPHPHYSGEALRNLTAELEQVLRRRLSAERLTLQPGQGEGNHLTFLAHTGTTTFFVRVDDGPEHDDYMELEASLHDEVRQAGAPTPKVYLADASRRELPVAFQVIEHAPYSDLNRIYKQGELDLPSVAEQIGRYVALWQSIEPQGFGLFDSEIYHRQKKLVGLHEEYPTYFRLNFQNHLDFLAARGFLSPRELDQFQKIVEDYAELLQLKQGCLVHKDLALWNILGTSHEVKAFIDWDDALVGDPTDDLSLLACFHSADVLDAALRGYQSVRTLPDDFVPRFWLHLLRNMVVKTVIRVGSGFFNRQEGLFLFSPGGTGKGLEEFTRQRLRRAYEGLRQQPPLSEL